MIWESIKMMEEKEAKEKMEQKRETENERDEVNGGKGRRGEVR